MFVFRQGKRIHAFVAVLATDVLSFTGLVAAPAQTDAVEAQSHTLTLDAAHGGVQVSIGDNDELAQVPDGETGTYLFGTGTKIEIKYDSHSLDPGYQGENISLEDAEGTPYYVDDSGNIVASGEDSTRLTLNKEFVGPDRDISIKVSYEPDANVAIDTKLTFDGGAKKAIGAPETVLTDTVLQPQVTFNSQLIDTSTTTYIAAGPKASSPYLSRIDRIDNVRIANLPAGYADTIDGFIRVELRGSNETLNNATDASIFANRTVRAAKLTSTLSSDGADAITSGTVTDTVTADNLMLGEKYSVQGIIYASDGTVVTESDIDPSFASTVEK